MHKYAVLFVPRERWNISVMSGFNAGQVPEGRRKGGKKAVVVVPVEEAAPVEEVADVAMGEVAAEAPVLAQPTHTLSQPTPTLSQPTPTLPQPPSRIILGYSTDPLSFWVVQAPATVPVAEAFDGVPSMTTTQFATTLGALASVAAGGELPQLLSGDPNLFVVRLEPPAEAPRFPTIGQPVVGDTTVNTDDLFPGRRKLAPAWYLNDPTTQHDTGGLLSRQPIRQEVELSYKGPSWDGAFSFPAGGVSSKPKGPSWDGAFSFPAGGVPHSKPGGAAELAWGGGGAFTFPAPPRNPNPFASAGHREPHDPFTQAAPTGDFVPPPIQISIGGTTTTYAGGREHVTAHVPGGSFHHGDF